MLANVPAAMENDKNDPLSARDPPGNELPNDSLLKNTEAYSAYYSEASLWDKILKYGRHAGISVIYAGLLLYYLLQKEGLPIQVKVAILGALGYFIMPADVLPDIFMGLGYTDDLTVLMMVLTYSSKYIDQGIKAKARAKIRELFGESEGAIDRIDKWVPSAA
jgi:uncharacterized membrane protein YkvA (DUF1232 family)